MLQSPYIHLLLFLFLDEFCVFCALAWGLLLGHLATYLLFNIQLTSAEAADVGSKVLKTLARTQYAINIQNMMMAKVAILFSRYVRNALDSYQMPN